MSSNWSTPEPGTEQVADNLSEVEAFMVSRIDDLQEYGWSNETIAEALGVSETFVEEYSSTYFDP